MAKESNKKKFVWGKQNVLSNNLPLKTEKIKMIVLNFTHGGVLAKQNHKVNNGRWYKLSALKLDFYYGLMKMLHYYCVNYLA